MGIVTMDALKPLTMPLPEQNPKLLPYLVDKDDFVFDVDLSVFIQTKQNKNKQLTHHTVTGCPFNAGDLLGSGTISGKDKAEFGSLLELSWNGKEPLQLEKNETRTFLEDGDKITITGAKRVPNTDYMIGFGECNGVILPAHDPTLLGKL